MLVVAGAITLVGGALFMVEKLYAKAEPHLPPSRQDVRQLRSWAEDKHAEIRGEAAEERQDDLTIQMAILKAVDPKAAEKLERDLKLQAP